MKLFLHATAFLSSFLLFSHALLVPPSTSLETSNSNIKSVAGSIGPHNVSIHFSTPCEECVSGTDNGLEFTLDVDEANTECSGSNLRLNGVPLSFSWSSPTPNSVIGAGDLKLTMRLPNGLGEREYYTKWGLICLEQEATFIEVRLCRIDGGDVHTLSGFSASFKQTGQPAVLKLESTPRMAFEEIDHDAWRSPGRDERLVILPTLSSQLPSGFPTELEEEFRKLQKLKAEAADLEIQIKDAQAGFMKKFWKAEFADCSTWRCYLTTAVRDAPMFAKLIAHHFRHHDKIDESFFKESSHRNCSDKLDTVKAPQDQAPVAAVAEVPPPTPAEPFSFVHASPVVAPPKTPSDPDAPALPDMPEVWSAPESPAAAGSVSGPEDAPFPFLPPWMTHDHKDGPPPWAHHGPPPWVKDGGSPPWGQGPPPWVKDGSSPPWGKGPPPWVKDGSSPPWGKGPPPWARPDFHNPPEGRPPWPHHPHPHHHGPPPFGAGFLSLDQQWKYRLIAAITSFTVVVLFATCLFTCVRRRTKIFRDPRRRAECAARREERATRRAYKKAACKHKWRTIFNRFRRTDATSDYEEKQELLRTKETGDENVVGEQIGNLRAAHSFIGELMRAEEGQSRTRTQGPATGADAGERGSIRSETLPAYSTTAPPDYAVDVPGDISVIDGFTSYTTSGADDTPESSVIDCSPRMSFETQRTTFTRVSQE